MGEKCVDLGKVFSYRFVTQLSKESDWDHDVVANLAITKAMEGLIRIYDWLNLTGRNTCEKGIFTLCRQSLWCHRGWKDCQQRALTWPQGLFVHKVPRKNGYLRYRTLPLPFDAQLIIIQKASQSNQQTLRVGWQRGRFEEGTEFITASSSFVEIVLSFFFLLCSIELASKVHLVIAHHFPEIRNFTRHTLLPCPD